MQKFYTGIFSSRLCPRSQRFQSEITRIDFAAMSDLVERVTRVQTEGSLVDFNTRKHRSRRTRGVRYLFVD